MAKTLARRVIPPFVVSCGFLLTSNPRAQTSAGAPPSQTIPADAEELIAEKPPSCPALDDEDVASANGRKVAWRCPTNDRWTVIVNGVPQGGGFEEARWLIFSPDGQHMAFAARRDKRWMIVEDGRERPTTYAEVGPPEYSDDGKHIAYAAKAAKKWRLVVDGEPRGGEFDDIGARSFSPDGQRVAYVGRRRNKFVVVLDEKEGTPFDIIGGIGFSSDSRRFGYAGADVNHGFGKQKAVGRTNRWNGGSHVRGTADRVAAQEHGDRFDAVPRGRVPPAVALGHTWRDGAGLQPRRQARRVCRTA